ncbi:MAG: polyprenyl synthetase family protein [Thermoplasmatales archaeon]|nr:polyprenyl synthetase family protein [Thermoplasmatales archaeon]MCW6169667.1 polyprenyl synthetase family protein [Thermoplasmatales archaeon]
MTDFQEWQSGLHGIVSEINKRLLESIDTTQKDLSRMAKYTIEAGGKRFRPLLTVLAYEISCDKPFEDILDLAVGYELIHTASLVHDDIIDAANSRRGKPSLNAIDGINNAIVVGDYLFAKAYELGSRYGPEVSRIMANGSTHLAEGQITEAMNLGNLEISEDTYFDIISNKTARFFEACALGATTAANASESIALNLKDFAYNLGMAFQVTDDILDVVGDTKKIGKPTFTDFRHNAITLPLIHAISKSGDDFKEELRHGEQTNDSASENKIREKIIETGSIDYSFSVAKKFTNKALNALKDTGKSPDLALLVELGMSVMERIDEMQ